MILFFLTVERHAHNVYLERKSRHTDALENLDCTSRINYCHTPGEGGWFVFFYYYLSPFCFLLIEFHCSLSISYKILPDYFYYYCISIGMWQAVGTSFIRARGVFFHTYASLLCVFVCLIVLFHSCCSHAWVFGKTLMHEFPVSYSHTEWYFLISLVGAREYRHAQRTLL